MSVGRKFLARQFVAAPRMALAHHADRLSVCEGLQRDAVLLVERIVDDNIRIAIGQRLVRTPPVGRDDLDRAGRLRFVESPDQWRQYRRNAEIVEQQTELPVGRGDVEIAVVGQAPA